MTCRCLGILDSVPAVNEDQRKGVEIVRHALKQPMMQIAKNAGVDASVIVNKVMEADDPNLGYDALNGVYVNMMDAGIIDPTKVIYFRCWTMFFVTKGAVPQSHFKNIEWAINLNIFIYLWSHSKLLEKLLDAIDIFCLDIATTKNWLVM